MDIEKARQHLADAVTEAGWLDDPARYLSYRPGQPTATLAGEPRNGFGCTD